MVMTTHQPERYTIHEGAADSGGDTAEEHTVSDSPRFGWRGVYEIRVKGNLEARWSDWFDGFAIIPVAHDETTLVGPVADQAALHGMLHKIRDLGLPLLSVQWLGEEG
jgi:hypothetical protein